MTKYIDGRNKGLKTNNEDGKNMECLRIKDHFYLLRSSVGE